MSAPARRLNTVKPLVAVPGLDPNLDLNLDPNLDPNLDLNLDREPGSERGTVHCLTKNCSNGVDYGRIVPAMVKLMLSARGGKIQQGG